ncbi:MAG: ATP-binding cassette domain-containing protein [Bacteroidetes bacterium]|nr:ATP-binding cassette domain-containing protein [Bacteroidota bacterium]
MEISVQNLTKVYGPQTAVDGISFEVKKGEIMGFLGPNGAGKTTTMKMITGYMAPTSGDVLIDGVSMREKSDQIMKKIGYLPENNPLYLDMPVLKYLRFIAELQGISKRSVNDQIKKMINLCGLNNEKHKKIAELSKGYRQRVGLAQAMIGDPEVLLLDEPTSGLDPNQIIEIRNLIKQLGSEKTVMLSTHILSEVEATCDRILIINKGTLVADGTPASLRQQSQVNEVLQVRIEESDEQVKVKLALEELETVLKITDLPGRKGGFKIESKSGDSSKKEVFNLCVKNKWILTEMIPLETSLEDVFRELTV